MNEDTGKAGYLILAIWLIPFLMKFFNVWPESASAIHEEPVVWPLYAISLGAIAPIFILLRIVPAFRKRGGSTSAVALPPDRSSVPGAAWLTESRFWEFLGFYFLSVCGAGLQHLSLQISASALSNADDASILKTSSLLIGEIPFRYSGILFYWVGMIGQFSLLVWGSSRVTLVQPSPLPYNEDLNRITAQALIGREGTAQAPLRPMGMAKVDGRTYTVKSEGIYIDPGTPVRVDRIEGPHIIVVPVVEEA